MSNDTGVVGKALTGNADIPRKSLIGAFNLSTRAINGMLYAGIKTIGDLLKLKEGEKTLAKIKNLGKVSIDEVLEFMKINRLQFDYLNSRGVDTVTSTISRGENIENIGLSAKASSCLRSNEIKTVGDLLSVEGGEGGLRKIDGVGDSYLEDISAIMKEFGLYFDDVDIKRITIVSADDFEKQWKKEINKIMFFFVDAISKAIIDAQGIQSPSCDIVIPNIMYDCEMKFNTNEQVSICKKIQVHLAESGWLVTFAHEVKDGELSEMEELNKVTSKKCYTIKIKAKKK